MKKAIELKPEYINHRLELARTYVEMDKYDLAAVEFQQCLDLPESTSKDAMYKSEAKTELAAIQKKLKK